MRQAADVLIGMRHTFERIVATNNVPHLVLHAGMAVGTLFVGMDTGRFITRCELLSLLIPVSAPRSDSSPGAIWTADTDSVWSNQSLRPGWSVL